MRSSAILVPRALAALAALVLTAGPAAAPAAAETWQSWNAAVSGNADDPARWNPNGVPNGQTNISFGQSGTYSVLFLGTVSQTRSLTAGGGAVTLNVGLNDPHTTGEFFVSSNYTTLGQGRVNATRTHVGTPGYFSSVTLTGLSHVRSQSVFNSFYGGDQLGYDGVTQFYINGGSQYFCENGGWPASVGFAATAASTVDIAGFGGFPRIYSGLRMTGSSGLQIGVSGTANFFAQNGGWADIEGEVMLARDPSSSAYVNIGPVASFGTSYLRARSTLRIGRNSGYNAGRAELTVKNRAFVESYGRTDVGDPDGDAGCFLRVLEGGRFTTWGGLYVYNTPGLGLDLQGGLAHVAGGPFYWPAARLLRLSSTVGNPEFRISNGVANQGPSTSALTSQLFVGRAGNATLRLTRAGTVFATGAGVTTVGDSAGGVGAIVVDSSAAFTSTGDLYAGNRGHGALEVRNGGSAALRLLGIGAAPTGNGSVVVRGAGSGLSAINNVWVGGASGGDGGTGSLEVDSSAVLTITTTTVNPALLTIWPTAGSVSVANGGVLSTGTVDHRGGLILADGMVHAQAVFTTTTGRLSGRGALSGHLWMSGVVRPSGRVDDFGAIQVGGNFGQYGPGRYEVDLGSDGGRRCDTLLVTGSASLAGTLELRLHPSFVRTPGDTFTVLRCTGLSGNFGAVTWNGAPLAGQAQIVYTPLAVHVVIGPGTVDVPDGPRPGDPAEVRFASAGVASGLGFALDLPEAADVRVELLDVSGRRVATLAAGPMAAGRHRLECGSGGRALPSGVYFARAAIRARGWSTERSARGILVR